MKSVKRISSLLLTLLMILTMSVTTFAAGTTGSITIENPKADETYTAYKIFDVVYSDENYSYTIKDTNEWFHTVQNYNGLKLTRVKKTDQYIVEKTNAFNAFDFSSELKKAVTGKSGETLKLENGKASVSGLELGYYFVTSLSGALCNLTTTDPNAKIFDKNDVPFEKTENTYTANVGETVNYTITGKVPDTTGFTEYTYLITDTMSNGLTFNDDIVVKVNDQVVTDACEIGRNVEGNANKFTVSIPVENYSTGASIVVTYSATVNEQAITNIEKNQATLTYSNNPTDREDKKTTPSQEKVVYTSRILIDKYEEGSENKKLSGAVFVLYRLNPTDNTRKQYFSCNPTTKKVTWVDDITQATVVTTGADGVASFEGLADGTYYLEETKAPAGYNPLEKPQQIVVTGSDTDTSKLTTTAQVANSTGTLLPSTGGMGTTFFYVIGGIFVLASVVLLITRKRMEKVEK